ncbi:MAG: hypothetical protein PHC70_05155 [Patescibacteria group bacterium]|nr:hypothetical protein [Patescibacteria group bacterium]
MFRLFTLVFLLGCSSSPPPPAQTVPQESVLLLCVQSGDSGCLGYATRCKMAWKVDPSCQPLVERCGQNWIGMIEQACRIAFGEELVRRQETVERQTKTLEIPAPVPQPLPSGSYQIKEVVSTDQAPKARVTVTEEGTKEMVYICDVELPEGCTSPKACGIVNRQVCFPDQ